MERLRTYELEFINEKLKDVYDTCLNNPEMSLNRLELDIDQDVVIKPKSQRYQLFTRDEQKCVHCGLEATHYAAERFAMNERWHLNLYGKLNGNDVLFTKDHVKPKSKGGANHLSNYVIMCTKCNEKKGDSL